MTAAHFILYVSDEAASTSFYSKVLGIAPRLEVEGMSEFDLPGGAVLGLMPEVGIKRLLGDLLPDPSSEGRAPRSELYVVVEDPGKFYRLALSAGARELSPVQPRDWGHDVGYLLDLDGHVLAFARDGSED